MRRNPKTDFGRCSRCLNRHTCKRDRRGSCQYFLESQLVLDLGDEFLLMF